MNVKKIFNDSFRRGKKIKGKDGNLTWHRQKGKKKEICKLCNVTENEMFRWIFLDRDFREKMPPKAKSPRTKSPKSAKKGGGAEASWESSITSTSIYQVSWRKSFSSISSLWLCLISSRIIGALSFVFSHLIKRSTNSMSIWSKKRCKTLFDDDLILFLNVISLNLYVINLFLISITTDSIRFFI